MRRCSGAGLGLKGAGSTYGYRPNAGPGRSRVDPADARERCRVTTFVLIDGVGGAKPLNNRLAHLGYPIIGAPSDELIVVDYGKLFSTVTAADVPDTYASPGDRATISNAADIARAEFLVHQKFSPDSMTAKEWDRKVTWLRRALDALNRSGVKVIER